MGSAVKGGLVLLAWLLDHQGLTTLEVGRALRPEELTDGTVAQWAQRRLGALLVAELVEAHGLGRVGARWYLTTKGKTIAKAYLREC